MGGASKFMRPMDGGNGEVDFVFSSIHPLSESIKAS
jgi:hypothetical protein